MVGGTAGWVRILLSHSSHARIEFLNGNADKLRPLFAEHFDMDQLPQEYGGNADMSWDEPKATAYVSLGGLPTVLLGASIVCVCVCCGGYVLGRGPFAKIVGFMHRLRIWGCGISHPSPRTKHHIFVSHLSLCAVYIYVL